MSVVRTRFAPSPTGILHLGGLRTALFNFLFARQQGGKFLLRIEDTDQKRFNPQAERFIFAALDWAKLTADEGPLTGGEYGPYRQSERTHLYKEVTDKLLASGQAYHCFCSTRRLEILAKLQRSRGDSLGYDRKCRALTSAEVEARLQRQEPFMVRFKLDDRYTELNDVVFGKVGANISLSESDPVLLKSDGLPVYHLANVVDDHYMGITHVIRGTEWLPSTPKHLLLYEALGWKAPTFAHVPLLLNEKGQKLSKRNPDFKMYEIDHFRSHGYLPESVLNWLLSCGGGFSDEEAWFPGMSMQQMIDKFRLDYLTTHSAQLNFDKLHSCGKAHFSHLMTRASGRQVISEAAAHKFGLLPSELPDVNDAFTSILPQRIARFEDLLHFRFLWLPPDPSEVLMALRALCDPPEAAVVLKEAVSMLARGENLDTMRNAKLSKAATMRVLRLALFGAPTGPRVSNLADTLGLAETLRRIEAVSELLTL